MATTSNIPTTMRAWQYASTKGGLPKNLKLNTTAPLPKPGPNDHLIKVKAVALNPVDYKPAEVALLRRFVIPNPATPGIDFVGTIVQPAAGSDLTAGQVVFGCGNSPFAGGMLAEYGVASKTSTIALGPTMSALDGAAVGVAGLTALQSLAPKVRAGDRVFINGGSGGTGVFGIQFAKALGCDVTATCSSRNVELCRSLGADVVDYTQTDVVAALTKSAAATKPFSLVVDNVFADPTLYYQAHKYTTTDASYVVVAGTPSLRYLFESTKMKLIPGFLGGGRRPVGGLLARATVEDLTRMRTWFEEEKVRAVVDQVFPFEQAPQAFEKLKTGRAVGKIVVQVEDSL